MIQLVWIAMSSNKQEDLRDSVLALIHSSHSCGVCSEATLKGVKELPVQAILRKNLINSLIWMRLSSRLEVVVKEARSRAKTLM